MEDFGQEPSISFGKALIVFIVLHLVAVSGIYIFNSLKARNVEQSAAGTPRVAKQSTPAPLDPKAIAGQHDGQETKPPARTQPRPAVDTAKPVDVPHRKVAEDPVRSPVRETPVVAKETAQLYTVLKGDRLVTIAKKFHVGYDELLKINKIDDPKKLQIGQKLKIPSKAKN
jgi:LysM repeat protein